MTKTKLEIVAKERKRISDLLKIIDVVSFSTIVKELEKVKSNLSEI